MERELEAIHTISPVPVVVSMPCYDQTLEGVRQFFVQLPEEWKLECLKDIFQTASIAQAVIYSRSLGLADKLSAMDFSCSSIQPWMNQAEK